MNGPARRILITGVDGFLGKNLSVFLREQPSIEVVGFTRQSSSSELFSLVQQVDAVVHFAAENRPVNDEAFSEVNDRLTEALCLAVRQEYNANGRRLPIVFTSSIQAELDNPYGRSKLAGEGHLRRLSEAISNPCVIFRLPGVFGKWGKPNYNSVVATFCHQVSRGLPVSVADCDKDLRLVYVDDVVRMIIEALENPIPAIQYVQVTPEYSIKLGKLAETIQSFRESRDSLYVGRVGSGLIRALYATYVSYLPSERFFYDLPSHADFRGTFVEMLKTLDSGQISYFTAYPGVTRGAHYHHSKSEKFLVVRGQALFRFRHLLTHEIVEFHVNGAKPQIIDSIPGWSHNIKNVGNDELLVMLWANEIYDQDRPDTFSSNV